MAKKPFGVWDSVLDRIRIFLEKTSTWSGYFAMFLLGLAVNAVSDSSLNDVSGVLGRLFDVRERPLAWLSWFAVLAIAAFALGGKVLNRLLRGRHFEDRIAGLYHDKIDSMLLPFQNGRMAWATAMTLQSSPYLHDGWEPEQIILERDSSWFTLPANKLSNYHEYLKTKFEIEHTDGGRERLMVCRNSNAFSDSPTLRLGLCSVSYSQVRYYHEWVWQNPAERNKGIQAVLDSNYVFPNSLSLHLIICTSDGNLLLNQLRDDVDFYPGTWACSLGEQIDPSDFFSEDDKTMRNWIERALREELGILPSKYDRKNIRVFAMILEADIVNCALIAIVTLKMEQSRLESHLQTIPHVDYEFKDRDYLAWNDVPRELAHPNRDYHPTTGLRMVYSGIYHWGVPGFIERLMKAQ